MTMFHAVVWIDHSHAQVLQFDTEHVQAQKVKARGHHTKQHGNLVRTEHEFFGSVCDAVADVPELLVAGSRTALADMRHYIDKHRPHLAPQVRGWEVVDHPTENQLLALAREYFLKYDSATGRPTPS